MVKPEEKKEQATQSDVVGIDPLRAEVKNADALRMQHYEWQCSITEKSPPPNVTEKTWTDIQAMAESLRQLKAELRDGDPHNANMVNVANLMDTVYHGKPFTGKIPMD